MWSSEGWLGCDLGQVTGPPFPAGTGGRGLEGGLSQGTQVPYLKQCRLFLPPFLPTLMHLRKVGTGEAKILSRSPGLGLEPWSLDLRQGCQPGPSVRPRRGEMPMAPGTRNTWMLVKRAGGPGQGAVWPGPCRPSL